MVNMDEVHPNNKVDFLNARIRNFEEMMNEVEIGLNLARDRQINFVKTGEINTSEYEATKMMIESLEKEFDDYKRELSKLRKERANL
jgi:wobble nucleotide-excising tRNase